MDAFLTFLANIGATRQFFQVCVGACTMWLVGWMVTRGRSDKDALPAPAPCTIADVPVVPFTGGPRDTLDMLRELRDMARRRTEDSGHIRECVRIIREETKKQTELLQEIAEDQRLEHRLNAERQHRH
ncbi:hypothetical protein [Methylobacterium brachiatum]